MPLPALTGTQHRAGRLVDTGPVTPEQLASATRVASLSRLGILLFQQRIICGTLAHAVVRLENVVQQTAPRSPSLSCSNTGTSSIAPTLTARIELLLWPRPHRTSTTT